MGKWLCIIVVFLLALPGCGTDSPTRFNTFTPLTSIVITSNVASLPVGTSTQLTATGNFSGLFTRDITNQVIWSSAQPLTADFNPGLLPGRIKALVPGPATVTAVLDGVTSGSLILTVNNANITALTIAPLLPSLPLGLSQSFEAQGVFSDNTTLDLTKDVSWSSSDATVASISDDFSSKGKATSLQIGSTNITATFGTFPAVSTLLAVTEAALNSIAVTPANPSLLSLTTRTFIATGKFSDGTSRDITAEVAWESTVPTVATLATGNIVKTLTPGMSTIKATLGTVSGTSSLKVTGGSLQSIALTLAQANNNVLIKDTVSRVTARGTFSNNTSRDITGAVSLSDNSDNINVISVSGNLAWVQATGVTPAGDPAKIFATHETTVTPGEILLTITEPPLSSITISPTNLVLASGTSRRFSLTGIFPSSNQDLTPTAAWTSANPATATFVNDGREKERVHALTAGTADITAAYGGQTVTTSVTVVARNLQSLILSPVTTPATMIAGTEKKFKVEAIYTDGARQDVTEDAEWSINDSNVARFSDLQSDPGLVVAVDTGEAILTATFGNIVDTEILTVSQ
jgi:hypothetical protein